QQTIAQSILIGNPFMRSDHSSFWLNGYNALFITDTGELRDPPLRYHCEAADDDVAHVQVDAATRVAQATAQAAAWAADR
ncbi:MAG TPA: hypothetical protein VK509_07380, partial [Polyangiales bacterium]|nr:hypothetical protein [Polyangiales bacterium]